MLKKKVRVRSHFNPPNTDLIVSFVDKELLCAGGRGDGHGARLGVVLGVVAKVLARQPILIPNNCYGGFDTALGKKIKATNMGEGEIIKDHETTYIPAEIC